MLISSSYKEFEKPKSGLYRAVLADIIDLGPVKKVFKGTEKVVPMLRIVWILNSKDTEGNYFRVMKEYTASLSDKANLFGAIREITLSVPTIPFEMETLIGRNSELVVSLDKATTGKNVGKFFANVKAILAPQDNATLKATDVFMVPADFVRRKDKQPAGTAQPAAQPPAQQAAQAAAPAQQVADEDIPF